MFKLKDERTHEPTRIGLGIMVIASIGIVSFVCFAIYSLISH